MDEIGVLEIIVVIGVIVVFALLVRNKDKVLNTFGMGKPKGGPKKQRK